MFVGFDSQNTSHSFPHYPYWRMTAMTKAVNGLLVENLLLQFFQKCAAGEGDEHGEVLVAGENDGGGGV